MGRSSYIIYIERGAEHERTRETAPIQIPQQGDDPDRGSAKHRKHHHNIDTGKEQGMKRGHVTGTKRERTGASSWYKAIEAEHLKRIESEWQAKQQGK
jgi:hypothetical protein